MKANFLSLVSLISLTATGFGFAAPAEDVFKYTVGKYTVTLLVERRTENSKSILLGADDKMIKKYLQAKGAMASAVNTFLVQTDKNTVVVDTGFGGAIFDNLAFLGVKPENIDAVLITHMHGDHIGGLVKDGKAAFPKALLYLAEEERNYWTAISPQAKEKLNVYGSKVKTFKPAEIDGTLKEILPGIAPVAAFGHTPGHTLYLVTSGNEKLLIFGDLVHVQNIQMPLPQVAVTYDVDPEQAVKSREKIFSFAAQNKIPVTGMHVVTPAFGWLESAGKNEFSQKEGYSFKTIK